MEDIRHEMKAVIEKVETSESSLRQTMEEIQAKNEQRFDVIEAAVTHHTKILNEHGKILNEHGKEWAELKADMVQVKTDMVEVKSSIKSLGDKMTKRVDDHEHRITTIEKAAVLS